MGALTKVKRRREMKRSYFPPQIKTSRFINHCRFLRLILQSTLLGVKLNMPSRFKDKQPLKTLANASKSCATQVRSPLPPSPATPPSFFPLSLFLSPPLQTKRPRLIQSTNNGKQSVAYGKCISKSYTEVSKGMCEAEFKAFKECVQVGDSHHSRKALN